MKIPLQEEDEEDDEEIEKEAYKNSHFNKQVNINKKNNRIQNVDESTVRWCLLLMRRDVICWWWWWCDGSKIHAMCIKTNDADFESRFIWISHLNKLKSQKRERWEEKTSEQIIMTHTQTSAKKSEKKKRPKKKEKKTNKLINRPEAQKKSPLQFIFFFRRRRLIHENLQLTEKERRDKEERRLSVCVFYMKITWCWRAALSPCSCSDSTSLLT